VNIRRSVSGVAAFGLVGVGAVGLGVSGAAAPAQAFTGTCPVTVPAATLVADNVCEVQIMTVGSSTFTPPSGITKLSAVLVAGGGGALQNGLFYAGSGGAVVYIDSVPTGGSISLSVGAGGNASDSTGPTFVQPGPGGDTTLTAGSTTTATGGASGNNPLPFCLGATNLFASGNGARTNTDSSCVAGAGFSLSQVSGLDATLFPAASLGPDVYGDGGTGSQADPVALATTIGTGGSVSSAGVEPGTAGHVILRFAPAAPVTPPPPAPTLAATGVTVPWTVPASSAGMLALGAVIVALRLRRKAAR